MPTDHPDPADQDDVTSHRLVEIICAPAQGCAAICSCGWESGPQPSAGLAGSVWDAHVEAESR